MMKRVAEDYRKAIQLIDGEKEYFQVEGITYRARGDSRHIQLNPYYAPIPHTVIRDGLQSALTKLEGEMTEMYKDLQWWIQDDIDTEDKQ